MFGRRDLKVLRCWNGMEWNGIIGGVSLTPESFYNSVAEGGCLLVWGLERGTAVYNCVEGCLLNWKVTRC